MKKEYIEKAAKAEVENIVFYNICSEEIDNEESNYEAGRRDGVCDFGEELFIAGANWRINSVWHDVDKELPEYNRHVVNEDWFDFTAKDEKDLKRIMNQYPFKRWAYVDDLKPNMEE